MKHIDEYFLALLIYADDIILAGTSIDAITHIKNAFHSQFTIKDLGFLFFGS